jgi:tetratricopeptide (TPR) repeat protein/predicted Ser/Thr protein kinase
MADGCLEIETLIDFVDGRADPATHAIVSRHVSRCEDCRRALASLARTGSAESADAEVGSPRPTGPARTSSPSMLAIGAQVGRYVIAREVGSGGMGAVYAAHDPELGRMVAVKVLRRWGDRYMQARLRREAQAMARLAHPNVVAVHDVGAFGDQIFIAMEYVEGETLSHWMAAPHPLAAILAVFRAAGAGLAAAHAAGIVHRDFKPENVLIGHNGRVCVGDFGLARAAGTTEPSVPVRPVSDSRSTSTEPVDPEHDEALATPDGAPAQVGLTVAGSVIGTPYYMAPELYDGAPADERSDQFAFCVALLTAAHGQRLLQGDAIQGAPRAARLRALVGTCRLPRWIRAPLLRGLATDPAARFGSVDELLVQLAPRDHLPRWMFAAVGAAAVAGVSVAGWYAVHGSSEVDQRCTGAAAAYASTWTAERRAAVQAAFTASQAGFAADAFRQVSTILDRYAAQWTAAHTQTCRATRILGEQTEATLDLRMTCLERRRQEAAALIGALATSDTAGLTRAVAAATGLTDVAVCADVAVLRQVIAPPHDAATRARLAKLTPRLADARAKLDTGAYAAGLALVRPVAAEARALGYRPFEAEADFLQGVLEVQAGDTSHAEATLEAAVLSAEAARHDEIAARARTALVSLIGQDKAEYPRALALAPFASAAIARMGGNPDIEFELEQVLGGIAYKQSKLDVAKAHFEKALAIEERVHGPDHPSAAHAAHDLGLVALSQGQTARAAQWHERALAIYERVYGPDHPLVAAELQTLGNVHVDDGQIELAVRDLRRALAISELALGPDHPQVGNTLADLARALRAEQHNDEALALGRRAVEIGARTHGLEHPLYAEQLFDLANTLGRLGRYAEAAEQLHRAEAIFIKVHGPNHDMVARVHAALGEQLLAQSRWREAAALYERTIPELERAQDVADWLVVARINLACALLELHDPAKALTALAPLSSHLEVQTPRIAGYVRFVMARAVWDGRGDRKRVRELVTAARAQMVAAGPESAGGVAELDAWTKQHPGTVP